MSLSRGRTRDSSWQWLVIGVVLGLGCSGVFCLALYALNYVRFGVPGQNEAAVPTVLVFTVTPNVQASPLAANTTTTAPVPVLTTPTANANAGQAPTATACLIQPTDTNATTGG